ncbi:alpha/beta hydrolase [Streptomyces nigra]|uniref:alpha/beta hydrolase n=1 Tax=Streptomyces nigra TaxID=1827580 RepID=UPI0036B7BA6A
MTYVALRRKVVFRVEGTGVLLGGPAPVGASPVRVRSGCPPVPAVVRWVQTTGPDGGGPAPDVRGDQMPGAISGRRGRAAWCAALLLPYVLLTTGAAAPQPVRGGDTAAPTLDWRPCEEPEQRGFECATLRVPLDHDRPDGETIDLAVIRHAATSPSERIGSLFMNPGGPGGPGTDALPSLYDRFFPAELRKRFDIVSWDPRGVGRSTAVRCFASAEEATAFWARQPAGFPVGEKERRAWFAGRAELADNCRQRASKLLPHVSTPDTARDLDRLRQAVGDDRLRYWGLSYGTFLGSVYANLFPDKVGRVILDGNVDPRNYVGGAMDGEPRLTTSLRMGSDLGSADTFEQFLTLCGQAPTTGCAFSAGSPEATREKYTALMERLRGRPVGTWTYARAVSELRQHLYFVEPGWAAAADMLQALWQGRAPQESPPPPPGKYPGTEQEAAVVCSESPNPRELGRYPELETFAAARAGDLGRRWVWDYQWCARWPATAADRYTGPFDRRTAHPVLVVNPVYDPATSYQAAEAMTSQLGDARLLTLQGYGHTALLNPSTCVNDHAVRYFTTGALPPVGATCRQDEPPFGVRPTGGIAAGGGALAEARDGR